VSGRILIDVSDMLALAASDAELDSDMRHELADLADDLNSSLDGYEVMLAHLDTADYLSFEKRDPTEGDFWAAEQAEREAIVADLFAEGEGTGPDPARGAAAATPGTSWAFGCTLGLAQEDCGAYLAAVNSRGAAAGLGGCPSCTHRIADNAITRVAEAEFAESILGDLDTGQEVDSGHTAGV